MTYPAEYRATYWAGQVAALTAEEKRWLLSTRRRRRSGERKLTNAEIGAKIGKPAYWVSGVSIALGSRLRVGHRTLGVRLSEHEIAQFTKMWRDGVPCAEIGRHWGFSEDWATMRASRLGLPPRTRSITNRQSAEIKERRKAGETLRAIAQAMGIAFGTVQHHARGVKPTVAPIPRSRSRVDAGMADRMARNGMRHQDIAAHFGVARSTVTLALRVYRKRLEALSAQKPKTLIPPVRIAA